jgi:nitrite reductase/ring-hydroxylating ferredoxin subunit
MTIMGQRTGLEELMCFGSETIPRGRFTSKEFLALEYERLWPHVWQIACRVDEVREPGDFVEYSVGERSVIVVRGRDGAVRAFHNTCPHRGTRLGEGCGRFGAEIRCPFHGWRWDLAGTNTFVLDPHEFPPMTAEELRLLEVHVGEWGGFVFVHFGASPPEPLLSFLDPIPRLIDPYHPERMRYTGIKKTILPANWKVVVDAFNEGYHITATHPELLRWKDETALEYEVFRTHTRYGGAGEPKPSPRLGLDPDDVDQQQLLALKIQDLIDNLPGYFGPDDLKALDEVTRTPLGPGVSAGDYYLRRRRDGAAARGLDWSHLSDDQVLGGDDVLLFPNFLGPAVGGGWFVYRVTPNGDDPHTCVFELWTLSEEPLGAPPAPLPERQWYPDPWAHDWGLVVNQDLANFDRIQRGLRVPEGGALRWNRRQEMGVRRFHEVLDRYLFDAPT